MSTPAISVRDLTKRYKGVAAVEGLDFEVRAGTITGFLGPNGAGKSTTIRALMGLIRPDSGEALIGGVPYHLLDRPVRRVGALIDGSGFHPGRSARSHLSVLAAGAGIPTSRVEEVLELVDLKEAADRKVGGFSLGMRQRLGLAGAILGEPEVLVLDEPSNGLDPAGIRWMRSFLQEYAASGRTVFVSSHVLSEMTNLVQQVVVIKRGRLVAQTDVDLLLDDHRVFARTPEPEPLARALASRGAEVHLRADGVLEVADMAIETVANVALQEGIAIYELGKLNQSLEDMFLQLTGAEAGDA